MQTLDYQRLWGGLDTRINFYEEQDNPQILNWMDGSYNVEIYTGLLRKMNGNQNILTTPVSGGILGGFEYEVNNVRYLVFNGADGNFYLYNGGGTYTAKKTGLSATSPSQYCQYLNRVAVCNGVNEIFLYDKTLDQIIETNFTAQAADGSNPVGFCCASYQGRLWVANGYTLYYSDLGDPTTWVDQPANNKYGGFIANFMGNTDQITCLATYGTYLVIYTDKNIYLLTGSTPSDFTITAMSQNNAGCPSAHASIGFNRNEFFFNPQNIGVYTLGQFTDIGYNRIGDSVTRRIYPTFSNELDNSRLNQIYIVPYINRNQLYMYIPEIGGTNLSACYVLDMNYMTPNALTPDFVGIYKRVGLPVTCAFNWNGNVYTGDANGNIYQEDTGSTFNGACIPFNIYFPFFSFGQRSLYKNIELLKLWCNSMRVNNFVAEFRFNSNLQKITTKNIIVNDTYGVFDSTTSLFDIAVFADQSELSKLIGLGSDFFSIQLGFSGNNGADFGQDIALRAFSFINVQELQTY